MHAVVGHVNRIGAVFLNGGRFKRETVRIAFVHRFARHALGGGISDPRLGRKEDFLRLSVRRARFVARTDKLDFDIRTPCLGHAELIDEIVAPDDFDLQSRIGSFLAEEQRPRRVHREALAPAVTVGYPNVIQPRSTICGKLQHYPAVIFPVRKNGREVTEPRSVFVKRGIDRARSGRDSHFGLVVGNQPRAHNGKAFARRDRVGNRRNDGRRRPARDFYAEIDAPLAAVKPLCFVGGIAIYLDDRHQLVFACVRRSKRKRRLALRIGRHRAHHGIHIRLYVAHGIVNERAVKLYPHLRIRIRFARLHDVFILVVDDVFADGHRQGDFFVYRIERIFRLVEFHRSQRVFRRGDIHARFGYDVIRHRGITLAGKSRTEHIGIFFRDFCGRIRIACRIFIFQISDLLVSAVGLILKLTVNRGFGGLRIRPVQSHFPRAFQGSGDVFFLVGGVRLGVEHRVEEESV